MKKFILLFLMLFSLCFISVACNNSPAETQKTAEECEGDDCTIAPTTNNNKLNECADGDCCTGDSCTICTDGDCKPYLQ